MAGSGYKVADAYADFHVDIDAGLRDAAARLKAKGAEFDRMGRSAGESYTKGFNQGLKPSEHLAAEIKQLQAKNNQITRAGGQAGEGYTRGFKNGINLRSPMVEQIAVVKSSRAAFGREGKQAGQEYAKGFGGSKLSAGSIGGTGAGDKAGEEMGQGLRRGFAKGSEGLQGDTQKVAARTQASFQGLLFLGLSEGLPAAAAIGAAGVTAALAVVPVALIAMAIATQRNNEAIIQSSNSLTSAVTGDVQAMTTIMVGPMVSALGDVQASWKRLAPQVAAATIYSAGYVKTLTGAVTDFAENAMPGAVTAVKNFGPAAEGLRSFSGSVGAGLSEFFVNISQGSVGAGKGMTILGGTVQLLEGRLGTMFASLANGSQGPMYQLYGAVDQVTAGINSLVAVGSGGIGFLTGFGNAGLGTLTALRGVAGILSALPQQVTQFGGSMSAAAMIASQFGINAGQGFQGLGQKISDADGAGGKFKAGLIGLAAGALNPAMLAVAGLGIALDVIGQKQANAAMYTQRQAENVKNLTQAIREDSGAIGQHTQAANVEALQSKNAAANLAGYGASLGLAKLAIEGNTKAKGDLNAASDKQIAKIGAETGLGQNQIENFQRISRQLLETGGSYDQMSKSGSSLADQLKGVNSVVDRMPESQKNAMISLLNAQGAVGDQIRAQRDAYDAYVQSEHALTGLSATQIAARDATISHTQATYDGINASLGYQGTVLNTKTAIENMNKVNKDVKSTENDKAAALLGAETAMQRQIAAAGTLAGANAGQVTDNQRLQIATQAQNQEALNLASTWQGPLPASLETAISKMSATEIQSAGLKLGINQLGQAVVTLPNGKDIVITSNGAEEAAKMQLLRDKINAIPTTWKSVIDIVTVYSQVGTAAVRTGANAPDVYLYGPHSASGGLAGQGTMGRLPGFAQGGMPAALDVTPGGQLRGNGSPTSDSILAALAPTEMIVNAKDTARNLAELYAINSGKRDYERYPDTGRPPVDDGIMAAAAEALKQVRTGGQMFEDFSFKGASANLNANNDALAKQYYDQGGKFDGTESMRTGIQSWLEGFIKPAAVAQPAVNAVASSVGDQLANFSRAMQSKVAAGTGDITINVYAQPDQDLYALASAVSRELTLRGK